MIKTSLWPLQQALYKRLSEDTALMQRITGVYDSVSSDAVFPYVTIGEPNVSPFETKLSYGENIPWVLHCWSQYPGKKESYEILNLMLQALTKTPFTVDGFKVFKFNIEPNMTVLEDIVKGQYHGIMRVRFHIQ